MTVLNIRDNMKSSAQTLCAPKQTLQQGLLHCNNILPLLNTMNPNIFQLVGSISLQIDLYFIY